jgi:hypothetical protein
MSIEVEAQATTGSEISFGRPPDRSSLTSAAMRTPHQKLRAADLRLPDPKAFTSGLAQLFQNTATTPGVRTDPDQDNRRRSGRQPTSRMSHFTGPIAINHARS